MAFEKLKKTVTDAGKTVSEKTKQGSDIVKANLKIASEERSLTDLYCEIGKTYYEKNGDNPCCDTMKELCEKVAEKTTLIENLKQQVRSIKGVAVCGSCGAEVPLENDFCGKCGAKIEKPEPVEEEEAQEEEIIDHETAEEDAPSINIEVDTSSEE